MALVLARRRAVRLPAPRVRARRRPSTTGLRSRADDRASAVLRQRRAARAPPGRAGRADGELRAGRGRRTARVGATQPAAAATGRCSRGRELAARRARRRSFVDREPGRADEPVRGCSPAGRARRRPSSCVVVGGARRRPRRGARLAATQPADRRADRAAAGLARRLRRSRPPRCGRSSAMRRRGGRDLATRARRAAAGAAGARRARAARRRRSTRCSTGSSGPSSASARFVADASHELRTPLALLKAELEVALRDGRTPGGAARGARARRREEADRLVAAGRGPAGAGARRRGPAAGAPRAARRCASCCERVARRFERARPRGGPRAARATRPAALPCSADRAARSSRRSATSSTTRCATARARSTLAAEPARRRASSCTCRRGARLPARLPGRTPSSASRAATARARAAAPGSGSRSSRRSRVHTGGSAGNENRQGGGSMCRIRSSNLHLIRPV